MKPKLRSFFANDLDFLRFAITLVLAKSAQRTLEAADLDVMFHRLETVFNTMKNREFSDLIRKK